jgi:predicted dehydrogenase
MIISNNDILKVGIIGCGAIGRKRALALDDSSVLIACCDVDGAIGGKFASDFSCKFYESYEELFQETDCDIVIVAAVNKYARDIAVQALKMGKHVLAEKPLGRNAAEAQEIVNAVNSKQLTVNSSPLTSHVSPSTVLKTGFNHRFHPTIRKAKELLDEGAIGQCFNIRARYGHGGRPGMENEWRASKDLCGGGELLDQGVHVIDLIRWFGGEVNEVYGKVETKFWNMEVEDNAFAILKTDSDATASFHVSWTNWKNIFSFEVFGTDGYLRIEGLGGSYGPETLEFGRRRKEGGVPDIQRFEFPPEDISWKMEWQEFVSAIEEKRQPLGNGIDGLRANEVIEAIYESSRTGEKRIVRRET